MQVVVVGLHSLSLIIHSLSVMILFLSLMIAMFHHSLPACCILNMDLGLQPEFGKVSFEMLH